MTVGEQRGSRLDVGAHEGFERSSRVVLDQGQSQATGSGIEIFAAFAPGPRPAGLAVDHLDGPGDEDLARVSRLEKRVADAERHFRLIHFDDAFQKVAIGIDH